MREFQLGGAALATIVVLLTGTSDLALECGDISGGGDRVHASDALAVLRRQWAET